MKDKITTLVDSIETKINLVVERNKYLLQKNLKLQDQNNILLNKLEETQKEIGDLKDQFREIQELKEKQGNLFTEGNPALKEQLDEYISKIDACVDWLTEKE